MWKITFSIFFLFIFIFLFRLTSCEIKPLKSGIKLSNLASIQRGAKYFMNYCSGCHSLQHMRYTRLGIDLKIQNAKFNSAPQQRLKNNLSFTSHENGTIKSSLPRKESLLWFGRLPPDLSLSTRARSANWVYNYLLGFYLDDTRPFGVNNSLIKNTAMPDPLAVIRMDPHAYSNNRLFLKTINSLYSSNQDKLKNPMLEEVITDLVNFLAYTAEPTKNNRHLLGEKVCGFLLLLIYFVYNLKKRIWRNIEDKCFS